MSSGFAVVEIETTGLSADRGDRIIEIAVLQLDSSGRLETEWTTLLNPGRNLGPTHIHGIRRPHILHAPRFRDIAPHLVGLLQNRVIVTHNAIFDISFLRAELERAGLSKAVEPFVPVCTMLLSNEIRPGTGRSLVQCCESFGVQIRRVHEALADAQATALLLQAILTQQQDSTLLADAHEFRTNAHWPLVQVETSIHTVHRIESESLEPSFLSRTAQALGPWHTVGLDPRQELEYLGVLDAALSDGFLDIEEADMLRSMSDHFGFKPRHRANLHQQYFENLVVQAWSDGDLSVDDLAQLRAAGIMLSLSPEIIAAGIAQPSE